MSALDVRQGDVLDRLQEIPDESVNCCVTSPPYYGLRDYGCAGQIGLEKTPELFISRLVEVFREVRRVLRSDGTCWINIGDSYSSQGGKQVAQSKWQVEGASDGQNGGRSRTATEGLKPKDLIGIPWMLAFALRSDGWYLRQDIIWSKPNPMPESVRDRCTKAHEYLFLLTKSSSYFYEIDAIRETPTSKDKRAGRNSQTLIDHSPVPRKGIRSSDPERFGLTRGSTNESCTHPGGRNKRSVWSMALQPTPDAHFATFPLELPETCILAGCPEGGTVLDPFSGAGTTGLAALKHGRRYIGIELNPAYIAISHARLGRHCPLLGITA